MTLSLAGGSPEKVETGLASSGVGEAELKPDLTVSLICDDSLNMLLPCLRSVVDNTHATRLEVIVVDNASAADTETAVGASFPGVRILANEEKLGFSTNNNKALSQGQGRYLMLLNDDTLVLDDALDRLVAFMDAHPQAGAAGSFLVNPDYTFQPSFARFPHPVVEALWPATRWSYRLVRERVMPFEVDSVCGAAMLVRREVLEQVGGLDTAFDPGYSEEVDWCYRIRQAGWKIYALPEARILHYGGQTMNRVMPQKYDKYELILSHKLLYFRKHAGARAANIYRMTLRFSTALKLVGWTLLGLVRKDHAPTREKRRLHRVLLERIRAL